MFRKLGDSLRGDGHCKVQRSRNIWSLVAWHAKCSDTIDLYNTGSRIHNKILKSSPPSWYSRSSALCGCKSKLLSSVFNFRKFP